MKATIAEIQAMADENRRVRLQPFTLQRWAQELGVLVQLLDDAPRDAFGVFYDADAFAQDVARLLGKPNPDDPDAE